MWYKDLMHPPLHPTDWLGSGLARKAKKMFTFHSLGSPIVLLRSELFCSCRSVRARGSIRLGVGSPGPTNTTAMKIGTWLDPCPNQSPLLLTSLYQWPGCTLLMMIILTGVPLAAPLTIRVGAAKADCAVHGGQ